MERLRYSLNLYRRYPYWRSQGVIFVHIPKAAGTSINKALYGRTLGHYTAGEIRTRFPRLYRRSFVFSVVRNPWDRVLSAYRFAKAGRTESMGMSHADRYRIPEFSSFERFLFDWLALQDLNKIDFVFQPQIRFVCDPMEEDRTIVNYLGKMETLDSDMQHVSEKLGRSLTIPRYNATRHTNSDFRSEYKRSEMVDLVGSLYKKDVSIFDYSFE